MKLRFALTLSLLLSSCGQADEAGSEPANLVAAATPDMAQAAGLTPAYLEGQWCHTNDIVGDERSDEMLSFIFSPGGTLLYQTNSTTEVENPGTYVIDGRNIKIKQHGTREHVTGRFYIEDGIWENALVSRRLQATVPVNLQLCFPPSCYCSGASQ